ncbi:uncharacterized protein [Linepithema humile]|uniref:uncharacterized protein n=1 Tax=Linepithema humile TaxID=83485 RepID=UPI00351F17AE
MITGENGQTHRCSTLLDSGSQSNFMTMDLCNKLGLHTVKTDIIVAGLNQSKTKVLETATATIESMHTEFKERLNFLVVPKITFNLPSEPLDLKRINIPTEASLADPDFHKPKKMDLLIGVDLFWDLICYETCKHPYLYKTKLGYVVSGKLSQKSHRSPNKTCNLATNVEDVSHYLKQFWEVEELPLERHLSPEEQTCESHFLKTTKRDSSGRFIVSIPIKASINDLGESKGLAERRLKSLERKLRDCDKMRSEYISFMRKYEELGHMTAVTDSDSTIKSHYLPHHGVIKEGSLTTKLRVVFDASAPTSNGVSINDLQMIGPNTQRDLLSIILCFRQYPYVVGADVAMMYRQVRIEPSQRSLQRILWREKPSEPIITYELNTITYGMASSSFLAIRCLFSLADEHQESFPKAADIIRNSMYVDDLLFGATSREETARLAAEVSHILETGCFELRKWISNDPQILATVGRSGDIHQFVKLGEAESTKTLGLTWSCIKDELIYETELGIDINHMTKRSVLSQIAKLFDPLGLLGPSVIVTKMILQRLWKLQLPWDDPLPAEIQAEWRRFVHEFPSLSELRIPRQVCCSSPQRIEIHGFSDASEAAYGGCVYVRSTNEAGASVVKLLCSKSRVAPLKTLTIPKLELSAAHVLTQLVHKVVSSLDVKINRIYYWSDSIIVLSWIRLEPYRLQTFVRNRVADIQERSVPGNWRHVPSTDNPADLLSRGVAPRTLVKAELWWHEPTWLTELEGQWPREDKHIPIDLPEIKKIPSELRTLHATTTESILKFENYSKLERIERIIAYCKRFISVRVYKSTIKGPFNAEEIQQATITLVRLAQRESFQEEILTLSKGKPLCARSKLYSLKPFLHEDNTLRVGGRLAHSEFDFDKRHPMILSSKHCLTKLIFENEHRLLLHVGPQSLLAQVREKYWPIGGRNLARQVVHRCIVCFRNKPKAIIPQMADLPRDWVVPAPVFHNTGVDYAGPFSTRDRKGRGCKTYKSYLCLFICMTTKAIHLVSDLTTENFIMALRRFVSRRGRPGKIFSDNGTTFVGANSELKAFSEFFAENERILLDRLVCERINWHFIPAYSPHF